MTNSNTVCARQFVKQVAVLAGGLSKRKRDALVRAAVKAGHVEITSDAEKSGIRDARAAQEKL